MISFVRPLRVTNLSYVWKTITTFKNTEKKINWNGWKHKNREKEIRRKIEELAPPYMSSKIQNKENKERHESLDEEFGMAELNRALIMINRNSTPERDGIEYKMLKSLTNEMKSALLEVCNQV